MSEHRAETALGDLRGRSALITGGSRGVGLALAERLIQRGASVALVARDRQRLDEAVAGLSALTVDPNGPRAVGITGDVTDAGVMLAAAQHAESRLGSLSILVNNAGIGRYGSVAEQPPDEWRRVIDVNLVGAFNATRAVLPAIRRAGAGRDRDDLSAAAKQGYPNMTAYCASKWGLQGFMAALAAEVASEPIRCVTVVPGSILTDFGVRTREERIASGQKFLEPTDVADAVLYALCQPDRGWVQELTIWPR